MWLSGNYSRNAQESVFNLYAYQKLEREVGREGGRKLMIKLGLENGVSRKFIFNRNWNNNILTTV